MAYDIPAIILEVLDWLGTIAFAVSGALVGVRKRFDLFGVLFLAFVVSVAGGMMRDVLIGAIPPAAMKEIHYFVIAVLSGLVTFFWSSHIVHYQRLMQFLDAIGLALFAVVGTQKAIQFGIHPVMSALMGMITGIGGGMIRDVLSGEIPFVLRADLYALAALMAGVVVALGHFLELPPVYPVLAGAGLCLFLRMMAIHYGWRAPLPKPLSD
ncbi:trimeric intracellular cation channel family protein [Roseateles sp. SL47]|uniref:trimeric intracellular cation channel family protein n=1 Tax=Roseateles sp. SL47 TaxID=2995138 RepID=UPI00226D4CEC|nr:trimeric intracellular cation channel family protein [Roseateles sp. SL47]WAC71269.1 trimeric intracellular cation channel family protein [Roseateles sp. SL47]